MTGPAREPDPRLLVPAIYLSNVTTLLKPLRVSRVNDAVHIQYRLPDRNDAEDLARALLWG